MVKYYAVAHHGTAGLEWSHGYAEVVEVSEGQEPRGDQTTTVAGPFRSLDEAQAEAEQMNREAGRYL